MVFYRIFGANGHGKTTYIFDKLSECVKNKKKAFLVVPEQSAVMAEKSIIKRLGGKSNLYVEVINFKRLCNRVFRELGGLTSTHLDDGAKKMLMLLTLSEVSPFLGEYAKCSENAEFAEKTLSFSEEMKRSRVNTSMLEDAANKLCDRDDGKAVSAKLSDIALICEAYETKLSKIPGVCRDIYEKLCEKLREADFFAETDVFFDSFYGFTASEYEVMSLIAESADNTYVTFSCKKESKDSVFERSIKSAKMCAEIAEKCGCELVDIDLSENVRHKKGSSLYAFERDFCSDALSGSTKRAECDQSIQTVLCRNIYEEADFAASTVLELVKSGCSFSDIVICAKNTLDYTGIIDTAFEKAEIPLGMDIPETLSESALFELVLSALEGASTFSASSVIRYVKTGISGLCEREADLFETYVKTWDISPSLMRSDEDWTMNPDGYVDSEPDAETLMLVNSARKKVLICLDSLRKNLDASETVKEFCTSVYNLLADIKNVSGSTVFLDGNGGISKALLFECLDSFVSSAENEKITLSKFMSLLRSCGKNYDTGHIPARSDEVRFSSVDLVRCEGVKYVILLGVNSGVFPSSGKESVLISDSEKEMLKKYGIVLSESARETVFDELFLAYSAITSAKEACFISYLAEDVSSSGLYPSVIVDVAERLSGCKTRIFESDDVVNNSLADELLYDEYTSMKQGVVRNTLEAYFGEKENYKDRVFALSQSFSQADYLDKATTDRLYGNKIVTSYSRLEKMAGCPFSHFCTYVLKLKPEPVASLGPSEAGSVMHKILEELVPLLCKQKDDGTYPDETEAKELVSELLCRYLSFISHTELSKVPKRFVYLYNRLSRLLCEMAVNIVRELKCTRFEPSDFELTISSDAEIKPVPIDLGDGCTLYIAGQIDRVDVYRKDDVSYIKIIDYKTGKKVFKLKDIRCGFNLQMLLYLASIMAKGKEKYGEKLVPAGVLYSNVVSSAVSLALGEDDIDEEAGKVSKPVSSGIFINDDEILFAMDNTENSIYLPIGRKDGIATKSEALASLEEMGELLDFALETAKELAKEMKNGLKTISPFDGKRAGIDIDPCRYCDMMPVCMGSVAQTEEIYG